VEKIVDESSLTGKVVTSKDEDKPFANSVSFFSAYKHKMEDVVLTKTQLRVQARANWILPYIIRTIRFFKIVEDRLVKDANPQAQRPVTELAHNVLIPNRPVRICEYDDGTIEFELYKLNPKVPETVASGRFDLLFDCTNEPYIVRAGETVSLGYHVLRFELPGAVMVAPNRFKCDKDAFHFKFGIPQL
jgi:hypothetical protein